MRHGNGNCHSLLLTAGEAIWQVMAAVGESHRFQHFVNAFVPPPPRPAEQNQRQFYVLVGGEVRNDVTSRLLPNEADILATVVHQVAGCDL